MSRDSLYQQTRSHLAYLKLAAAAEALPGELDTAMKTKATHTEFLEKLLAIEVKAVEARRHAGLLRFANFPAPWRLEDFDYTAQPSVDPALLRDLATCRYAQDATNVLFIGPPLVSTKNCSKARYEPITDMVSASAKVRRIIGMVMKRVCCHQRAPSMRAAS